MAFVFLKVHDGTACEYKKTIKKTRDDQRQDENRRRIVGVIVSRGHWIVLAFPFKKKRSQRNRDTSADN